MSLGLSLLHLTALVAYPLSRADAAHHAAPAVWRSEGYGYVVEASSTAVNLYDLAADRCSLSDTVPTLEALGRIDRHGPDRFTLIGKISRIGFRRIKALPPACKHPAPASNDPLVNFDAVWTILNEHYPAFAERGVDWRLVRTRYRSRAEALGPAGNLWPLLTDMLGQLRDPHVHLVDGKRRFQARRGDPSPVDAVQRELISYLNDAASPLEGGVTRAAYDRLAFGIAPDRIGYLAVMTMGGFAAGPVGWPGNTTGAADRAAARQALVAALGRLTGTQGLILDLRYNPGGSEEIADLIAGCFADRQRLAYTRKARDGAGYGPPFPAFVAPNDCPGFRGPVAVLIGERTTSAAEALVMRLRVLPQVVVIGQPTQGAHSDVLNKTLPNGWTLGLSNEVYTLADGQVYEGRGIPPSFPTPMVTVGDSSDVRFGRDIRIAIRLLSHAAGRNGRESAPPRASGSVPPDHPAEQ